MEIRAKLKQITEKIPYSLGKFTAHIPFSLRLGSEYTRFCGLIKMYENASTELKNKYLIQNLNNIVQHAQKNIPFYQNLYGKSEIRIETLEDYEALPLITKPQIREYTKQSTGAMLLNTGGSTGEPTSFYIDKNAWAREWAHMHFIWALREYKQTDLIITMLGKNLGDDLYRYNAVHNEIKINPYMFSRENSGQIVDLFKKFPIKFFQGYPSSIYNFFRELELVLNSAEKKLIQSKIKSCFLSSEYPLPYMVDYLKDVWQINFISWYGHSEMCILAFDKENSSRYTPFITYGYAEDVGGLLCGTSFHNYSMPLIRYSTGDIIDSKKDDYGALEYFVIKEGREGDFIEDKSGNKIPLTSMVFGRHHTIFNHTDYLQIFQRRKGEATFFITFIGEKLISYENVHLFFDLSNLALDFDFIFLKSPIRTKGGKLKLKLSFEDVEDIFKKHKYYD